MKSEIHPYQEDTNSTFQEDISFSANFGKKSMTFYSPQISKKNKSRKQPSQTHTPPHKPQFMKSLTIMSVTQPQVQIQSSTLRNKFLYFMVFPGNNPNVIKNSLMKRGNFLEIIPKEDDDYDKVDFIWKPTGYPQKMYHKIEKANCLRDPYHSIIVNHIENMHGITTKTGLVRSLKKYYKIHSPAVELKYNVFDSTPTTFILQSECEDNEYHNFAQRYKEIAIGFSHKERLPSKHCAKNIWLVKPAAMNQGRGIQIFKSIREIKDFISSKPLHTYWIVQKYIEKPLLFKDRKFDIRVWALVIKGDLYFYEKGYLRTSSNMYTLENTSESYIHLTNNCLQKYGANYGVHEDGNTLSFEYFQEYLDHEYPQYNLNVWKDFIPRIKDLIIDTYLSIKREMNPNRRRNCFELLGYDFMIDEDFRVWLIEVNSNPYIGIPNDYIKGMLPKMIDDMMEIAVDPIFAPTKKLEKKEKNFFEIIYREEKGYIKINQRRPFSASVYPISELKSPLLNSNQISNLKIKRKTASKSKRPSKNMVLQVESTQIRAVSEKPKKKILKSIKTKTNRFNFSINNESAKEKSLSTHEGTATELSPTPNINTEKKVIPAFQSKPVSLLEKTKTLIKKHNVKLFKQVTQRINYCFLNFEQFAEKDIKECVTCLTMLIESKYLNLFDGEFITQLIAFGLNMTILMPSNIREALFEMMLLASKDLLARRFLIEKKNFHSIIDLILESCEGIYYKKQNSNFYFVAMKILSNLAEFGKSRFYIPGETVENKKLMHFFITYGGLLAVIYASVKSKIETVKNLASHTYNDLKDSRIKYIDSQLKILEGFLHDDIDCIEDMNDNTCASSPLPNHQFQIIMNDKNPSQTNIHSGSPGVGSLYGSRRARYFEKHQNLDLKNRSLDIGSCNCTANSDPQRGNGEPPKSSHSQRFSTDYLGKIELDRSFQTLFPFAFSKSPRRNKKNLLNGHSLATGKVFSKKSQALIDLYDIYQLLQKDISEDRDRKRAKSREAARQKSNINKQREEEKKIKEEKKRRAMQEFVYKYDHKKREKFEFIQREANDFELRMKDEQAKKRTLLDYLKKKEEFRKNRQFEINKKKADEDKKRYSDLEKQKKKLAYVPKQVLDEYHKKKVEESIKRKKSNVQTKQIKNSKIISVIEEEQTKNLNDSFSPEFNSPLIASKCRLVKTKKGRSSRMDSDKAHTSTNVAYKRPIERTSYQSPGYYFTHRDDELESEATDQYTDIQPESKREIVKTISHEDLKKAKKLGLGKSKKSKKDFFNEMDYKIFSIYSSAVGYSNKKKNSKKKASLQYQLQSFDELHE